MNPRSINRFSFSNPAGRSKVLRIVCSFTFLNPCTDNAQSASPEYHWLSSKSGVTAALFSPSNIFHPVLPRENTSFPHRGRNCFSVSESLTVSIPWVSLNFPHILEEKNKYLLKSQCFCLPHSSLKGMTLISFIEYSE